MDSKYMLRALSLALRGEGKVNPNPLVGAVIVKNGEIIGEGYHEFFGGPHAEINAINNTNEEIEGATLYVNLEPCSHYGKTPPCVEAIIKSKISRVVVAMKDPNPLVAGKGIQYLEKHGVDVKCAVCEKEAKKLNEIFIHHISKNRPIVIMKTAMTLDGKIATNSGISKWISNESSREYVHQLRNRVSGIMVGIGTVIKDNPSLTTRLKTDFCNDPVRIIVDSRGRIPLEARVINNNSKARTIVATTEAIDDLKKKTLIDMGVEVLILDSIDGRVNLESLLEALHKSQIDSVLLEGGGTLNWSMLQDELVDKVISFIAPKMIGGTEAKTPVEGKGFDSINDAIELQDISIRMFGDNVMIEGYCMKKQSLI